VCQVSAAGSIHHGCEVHEMRASERWQIYESQSMTRNLETAIKIICEDTYGCFLG
jgi:hypothetical protein